ncbi:DUF433 domain-containing protein [Halovivax cerinus]|uniref:DUF433 domain-containing protein n=1 Tax=Halovivax cerinus TaxID=1487865 RepID=A0ABD5NQ51_9EURY|nr:DUF433 domain-containing protein [Halovivax cerinus]
MASIVRTEDVLGGEPRIDGTRVGVLDVYELVIDGGYAPADVADQLGRSHAEIYTALAYYHDHPEEMRHLRRDREETTSTLADEALQPPEPAQ